jgi:hypothetical protein
MSRKRSGIGGQFAPRLIEMLESPSYQVLSLSAHRALARIEIEFAHNGGEGARRGNENGKLIVTFDDFERYGIHRRSIAPAIREIEALGFIEITERGRAGNAEYRAPHKFRLTYRDTKRSKPTHEWRKMETIEQAIAKADEARRPVAKNRLPVAENTKPSGGKCTETIVEKPPLHAIGQKPPLLSRSRHRDSRPAMWRPVLRSPAAWIDRLGRSQSAALAMAGSIFAATSSAREQHPKSLAPASLSKSGAAA